MEPSEQKKIGTIPENTSPVTETGEVTNPVSDEKTFLEQLEKAADDRINGKKPFFYVNPGFSLNYMQATISSDQGENTDAILSKSTVDFTYHYDIVSTGYQLTDWFGINFQISSHSFTLDRQIPEDLDLESSESNSDHPLSQATGEDLGTRMVGHYSYIMPTAYVGGEKLAGFRFGFGVGYGAGWLQGTVQFRNSGTENMLTRAVLDPSTTDELLAYNMASGLVNINSLDYVEAALLFNWNRPGNLERLGMYWTAKGYIQPSADRIISYHSLNPELTPFELAGLIGLSHNNIRLDIQQMMVFQIYADFPEFWNINTRLYVDVPTFKKNGYNFSITSINLAFYYPIGVGI